MFWPTTTSEVFLADHWAVDPLVGVLEPPRNLLQNNASHMALRADGYRPVYNLSCPLASQIQIGFVGAPKDAEGTCGVNSFCCSSGTSHQPRLLSQTSKGRGRRLLRGVSGQKSSRYSLHASFENSIAWITFCLKSLSSHSNVYITEPS